MPSRQFYIQQAVLNVAERKSIIGEATSYLRAYITVVDNHDADPRMLLNDVRDEFNRLVAQ